MIFQHSLHLLHLKPNRWLSGWRILAVTLALALCLARPVVAQSVAIPQLDSWLVDTTGTFSDAQKAALTAKLQTFEQSKGAQIFVLVVPTTGEDGIDQYARRVYDQWQLGRKKIDDGVLLVVAKDDRRLRIEVGYGLEGAVTDLQAGRIIREFITPYFKQDDYVGGINEGVDKIMTLVAGEDLPPPAKQPDTDEEDSLGLLLPLAFFAFVLPPLAAALLIGVFSFFIFGSLPISIVAGAIALILSLLGRAFGAGGKGNSGLASRRGGLLGGLGGGLGGGFGRGGRGGGGGFSGGGGGSSGGGGASGGW
ncbi:TPM domain-containing protein [Oceanisphaera sp. W20_SRM_FM3]|uniref:TPM domain-containing protein n=1 Tax=Oceanisphaera sp. W20_SRM_FM3 TaxID=3240267 RepID=UPI003F97FE8A